MKTTPISPEDLRDGAGFFILERTADNAARNGPNRGRLQTLENSYLVHDPYTAELDSMEMFSGCPAPEGHFGVASLPIALAGARRVSVRHELRARDGISACSTWEMK